MEWCYSTATDGYVRLVVSDVLGNPVATLFEGMAKRGSHEAVWNATAVPSGVYTYQLHTGNGILTRRMVLVR
ncbi:MAG: T9SS type A sorting domain-containing protein [Candidatus Kapabacteria bacterium]|nr:T9SS type A sorting domain-containing protein [Candidatus Kapabacteria bacterium]